MSKPISDYIAAFHSRNGFTHGRMPQVDASAFDHAMLELLQRHCPDGLVRQSIQAKIIWGVPHSQASPQ